ncbi:hypothetical protein VUR80DRAFT_10194 [Thermomyces stellatus]
MGDNIHHSKVRNEPRIQIERTQICDVVLRRVYDLAQEMCPTPLAYEKLKSWADACPDFSIQFQATLKGVDPAPVGVTLMLPILKEHWEPLLVGEIQESDLDPATRIGISSVTLLSPPRLAVALPVGRLDSLPPDTRR